jgi:hypothetical protein
MKKFLALLGLRTSASRKQATQDDFAVSRMMADNPATIEDGSDNSLRRQLVHVLLRDALRRHGIPPNWIECQMLVVSSRSRGPGMYVRMVVKHWDSRLMDYALAFEKTLIADIIRFEPNARDWLHGISWQLDYEKSSSFTELPPKSFWQGADTSGAGGPDSQPNPIATTAELERAAAATRQANAARRAAPENAGTAAPAVVASPVAASPEDIAREEAEQDLERLFAIRDRELAQDGSGIAQSGYEKTRPSPL